MTVPKESVICCHQLGPLQMKDSLTQNAIRPETKTRAQVLESALVRSFPVARHVVVTVTVVLLSLITILLSTG